MEAPRHIVKAFDFEIKGLNNKIAAMGKGCEWQLAKAVNALTHLDFRLAQEVIKEDRALNNLYKKLETDAVGLLAKRQPLAGDLRYLLAAMRAGSELERIGDYVTNISEDIYYIETGESFIGAFDATIESLGELLGEPIG